MFLLMGDIEAITYWVSHQLCSDYDTHLTPRFFSDTVQGMEVSGQHFNEEILARIQRQVASGPEISWRVLSRPVCEWLDWRSANHSKWQVLLFMI